MYAEHLEKVNKEVERDLLEACLTICRLCIVINPHHKGCNSCPEIDDLTTTIKDTWEEMTKEDI